MVKKDENNGNRDKDLLERLNDSFNSLMPGSLDNKILSVADRISSKLYSSKGASNNKIAQYLNMGGALASAVSGGCLWNYSSVFGAGMVLYAGMHAVQSSINNKRAEIDKREVKDKIDNDKIMLYAVQQTARKNDRFRRMGALGISIGFCALATASAIVGIPYPFYLGLYAFSAASFLDSASQYFKAAEITSTEKQKEKSEKESN